MNEEYTKHLENIIKQMLTPLKDIPLSLVIESISGYKILPFDSKDNKDKSVLDNLIKACNIAGKRINTNGISRARPNEVGNDIEPFVKDALKLVDYKADAPKTKRGGAKKQLAILTSNLLMNSVARIIWSAKHTTSKISVQLSVHSIYRHQKISR